MKVVRIVIFAKAPLAGLAKTRLIPRLGPNGSAALAARLIQYTVRQALAARVGPVELCAAPDTKQAIWKTLELPGDIQWSEQGDGDLGLRMARTAQRVIERGESLLLLGTDCPQLNSGRLRATARTLMTNDACLVPVTDGGYVLIGLNRYHPSLFADIPWSTADVAHLTRRRISALAWSSTEFPALHDIDEPDDLQWLPIGWSNFAASSGRPHQPTHKEFEDEN
jgi:hypothetical protein